MDDLGSQVTVCIPSIPPRSGLLARAVATCAAQTVKPRAISIAIDTEKEGAGPTRTRALMGSNTEYSAFLDDDDEMLSCHLEILLRLAIEQDADVVWSWFEVIGGGDPFRQFRGRQWNPQDPHMFPITALVRTEMAQAIGFSPPIHFSGVISGEDFPFWLAMRDAGAKFVHTPEITWCWHHDSNNTSGMPNRW